MSYQFSDTGSTMSAPGANPVVPSLDAIAAVKARMIGDVVLSRRVSGFMSQIDVRQAKIAESLGDRANIEKDMENLLEQYQAMKSGTPSQATAGTTVDTAAIDSWLERGSAGYRANIEAIDKQIRAWQAEQSELFAFVLRYVPSFQ